MNTKIANVRMPVALKSGGDAVLRREGMTFTSAVNALYGYLVKEQSVPECLLSEDKSESSLEMRRRQALRSFTGCVPEHSSQKSPTLDEIREARLAKQ